MKAQMLKIAGVKSEKEFYKKFPDEASFMKAHGKEFKKAMRASKMGKAQVGKIVIPGMNDPIDESTIERPPAEVDYSYYFEDPTAKQKAEDAERDAAILGRYSNYGISKDYQNPTAQDLLNMRAAQERTDKKANFAKNANPYIQAGSDVARGIGMIKQQKKNVKLAQQNAQLTGLQATAVASTPINPIKRQYLKSPVIQPDQLFPSQGVGTNVLAEDGAEIGGNPTEIQNTFAPNVIYTDLGYEPLSDSDRVKQYQQGGQLYAMLNDSKFGDIMNQGGGDALNKLGTAITGEEDAGTAIGGGIGQAAGQFFGGPVGGMLGKFAGKLIGDLVDTSERKIKKAQKQSRKNMASIMGNQVGMNVQNMFSANVKNGGVLKAQKGEELTKKDGKCSAEEARNKEYAAMDKQAAKENKAWDKEVAAASRLASRQNAQDAADYMNEGLTGYRDKIKKKDFEAAYQAFAAQNPELAKDRLLYTLANKELLPLKRNPDYFMRNVIKRTDPNIDYNTLTLPQLMQTMQKGYGSGQAYYDAWKEGFPMRQPAIQQVVPIQQENGGQTSEYEWISHTWQPQVITHFGEHRVSDLLRPPQDADMLRTGGSVRQNYIDPEEEMLTNMSLGGQIQTTWGGYAEPISQNPYLPASGQTIMFRGQSHDESDGYGRTGIGVKYGDRSADANRAQYGAEADADVEVERNEPAVELPNGDGENSMVVYGNLKIPNQFLDEIGDPKAKGKKFKTYVKDLAKKEQRQNKIIDSSSEKLDELNPTSPFDLLKFNSLAANIQGANMKLKQYAEFKTNAAAVQNAINDTAEELGLDADTLAKGKVKIDKSAFLDQGARFGRSIPKAQNGTVSGDVLTTDLGENITQAELDNLNKMYEKAKKQGKGSAVIAFQKEFHRLFPKSALKYNKDTKFLTRKAKNLGVKREDFDKIDINNLTGDLEKRVLQGNEDEYFGKITRQYNAIANAAKKKTDIPASSTFKIQTLNPKTTSTTTTAFQLVEYQQDPLIQAIGAAVPYLRPSDQEELDPAQLIGEAYALSQNQVEPVWAQKLTPRLSVPIDISYQDILNENRAALRRQQELMGYNPAAQSSLAAGECEANQKVLAEQFRANQAERNRVYEKNRDILNQYDMANLQLLDQQYVRQNEALSKTKATAQEALNSIASKIAQNKLENRTLATMENMYNYRYDPAFRAINMNPLYQPTIPTVYVGPDGKKYTSIQNRSSSSQIPSLATPPFVPENTYDQTNWEDQPSASMAKKGKKVSKMEQRNSSIVKALKNL